jgi:hypothetical protein
MAYNQILLKGDDLDVEYLVAGGTLRPGMIAYKHTDGTLNAHATSGASIRPYIVLEPRLDGRGAPATFATTTSDYSSGDQVRCKFAKPGEEYALWLYTSEVGVIGIAGIVESAGGTSAGTVRIVDADATWTSVAIHSIIGEMQETKTPSAAPELVRVRIW